MKKLGVLFVALEATLRLYGAAPGLVVPLRPLGGISDMTAGPKGEWFATLTSGAHSAIQIWTIPTAIHLRTFPARDARAIAAHPSRAILAIGRGSAVDLLDASNGSVSSLNESLPDQANALAWSPDGSYLLAGFRQILRVDPQSGRAARVVALPDAFEVSHMQFLKGGKLLVAAHAPADFSNSLPGMVLLYDTATWKELTRFEGHRGRIVTAVDATESTLAVVGVEGNLQLWQLSNEHLEAGTVDVGKDPLSIAFSSDGSSLGVYSFERRFQILDVASRSFRTALRDPAHLSAQSMLPVYGRSVVLGGSVNGDLVVLDGSLENALSTVSAGRSIEAFAALFNAEGVLLADRPRRNSLARYDSAAVWSLGAKVERIEGSLARPIGLVERHNNVEGPFMVLNDGNGLVFRHVVTHKEDKVERIAWAESISGDGRWAAGWGEGKKALRLFDTSAKSERSIPYNGSDDDWYSAYALSPAGNALAVAGPPGETVVIRVWSLPAAHESASFEVKEEARPGSPMVLGRRFGVRQMTFSHDGKRLALLDSRGRTMVWNVDRGSFEATFDSNADGGAIEFSPDGNRLAIGNSEGNIDFWDIATSHRSGAPLQAGSPVEFLKFRDDGKLLLAATSTNFVHIFAVETGRLQATLYLRSYDGPWMVFTDSGFFDGSETTWNEVVWRMSGGTFDYSSAARYFGDFFYPGLLAKALSGDLPRISAELETLDRQTAPLEFRPGATPAPDATSFDIRLTAPPAGGIRDVRLFRNGVLVHRWNGTAGGELRAQVHLESGTNVFTAYGFNTAGVRTEPSEMQVQGGAAVPADPGTLYVLAIGINEYHDPSLKLNFAVNDARMLAASLRGGRDELVEFAREMRRVETGAKNSGSDYHDPRLMSFLASSGEIKVQTLTDAEATREAILQAIRETVARAQPRDSFILFFAGHGDAEGKSYYLFPQDVVFSGRSEDALAATRKTAISDSDLVEALQDLDVAAAALIIDACESGQAAQTSGDWRRGPIDADGLAQFAFEKDILLLAASQSNQSAAELERLQHGLLTWTLVEEGLREGRALNATGDGLELGDWLSWAAWRVPLLHEEAVSAKRAAGLILPPGATPDNATVQRPMLQARRRPGAPPLIVAATTVDIDPLTLTVKGSLVEPRVSAAKPIPERFILPESNPGDVKALAIGPREDWVITAESTGRIRIWRLPDLLPVRSISGPPRIMAAALSPDGSTLACLTTEADVSLVDLSSGAERSRFTALSPARLSNYGRVEWLDSGTLLLGLADGVEILDAAKGTVLARVNRYGLRPIWSNRHVLIAANYGARIGDQIMGGEIYVVDLDQPGPAGPNMRKLGTHPEFRGAAYDPARSLLVSAGADGFVRFWDVREGRETGQPVKIPMNPNAVLFRDGAFLIAGDTGDLYSIGGPGAQLMRTPVSKGWRYDYLASSGATIAAASSASLAVWKAGTPEATAIVRLEGTAQVVSISNENLTIAGQRVTSASGGLTFGDLYSYRAGAGGFEFHSAERAGATIKPDGSAAIVSSDGNTIRAYHPASLKILASIPVKAGTAAMSADYSRLAWCAKPGATGYSLFIAETPAFRAQRLASSRDGGCGPLQWTMADGEPGLAMEQGPTLTVHVYPVPNGQERIVDIQGAALNGILAFALDPDGETAAIVTNSEFELVDVRKHSVLRKLPSSFGPSQLQFSPDGRLIAAADRDGEVALVELGKDDNRSTILAPLDSSVTALAFSGDGRLLAVLSNTGGCQIYDAASGELLARIRPVPGTQTLFVEAPDGRFDAPREVWTRIFRNTQGGIVPLSDRPDGYTAGLLGLLLRGQR